MKQWQTVNLFLSSTFKDMELQRDQLARVFSMIHTRLAERQLFFGSYDLRWRLRHEEQDLVQWCIAMVEQCQYFVGILGYRYGWRPERDTSGRKNIPQYSITEMEIRHAQQHINPEKRFYLAGELRQYSKNLLAAENKEDITAVESLKHYLRQQGEKVFAFSSTEELLVLLESELQKVLDRHYPPGEKAQLIEHTRREAL